MGLTIGPVNQGIAIGAALGAAGAGVSAAAFNSDGELSPTEGRVGLGLAAGAGSVASLITMGLKREIGHFASGAKFGGGAIGVPVGVVSAIALANLVSKAEVPSMNTTKGPGVRVSVQD